MAFQDIWLVAADGRGNILPQFWPRFPRGQRAGVACAKQTHLPNIGSGQTVIVTGVAVVCAKLMEVQRRLWTLPSAQPLLRTSEDRHPSTNSLATIDIKASKPRAASTDIVPVDGVISLGSEPGSGIRGELGALQLLVPGPYGIAELHRGKWSSESALPRSRAAAMEYRWRSLLVELTQELERQSLELQQLKACSRNSSKEASLPLEVEPAPPLVPAPRSPVDQDQQLKQLVDASWSLSLQAHGAPVSKTSSTAQSTGGQSTVGHSKGVSGSKDVKDVSQSESVLNSWIGARRVSSPEISILRLAAKTKDTKDFTFDDAPGFTVMRAQKTRKFVHQKPWYVMNPDTSTWATVWQGVVAAALMFVAFVTPVQVGLFELHLDALMVVSFCVDFVFLTDMILQFFTTYSRDTSDGIVWEVDLRQIALHYLQTWFLLDFITVIPFDVFTLAADGGAMDEFKSIKVLRALRLLKLIRLAKTSRLIHNLEIPLSIPYQKVALARFLIVLGLFCHWVACFWAMTLNLGSDYENNWFDVVEDQHNRVPHRIYVAAFYYACYTITSVGYGDITPQNVVERSICSGILLASGLAWAYILGEVGAIVSDMTSESQEFRRRMHHLNVMMQEQGLHHDLRRRLRSFFLQNRHHWVHQTRNNLLESMSPSLQNDVCMQTQLHWLRKVTVFDVFMKWVEAKERVGIFTGSFYGCVADVTRQLRSTAFAQQETFANVQVLYILSKGLVMLNKKVGAYGEVWGEDFVLSDPSLVRPIAGTALTYIEVHYLTREALMEVIARNRHGCPQLEKIVRRYCVRLAVYRGIIAEARRRAKLILAEKVNLNE
eukprot:s1638_g5.t1